MLGNYEVLEMQPDTKVHGNIYLNITLFWVGSWLILSFQASYPRVALCLLVAESPGFTSIQVINLCI